MDPWGRSPSAGNLFRSDLRASDTLPILMRLAARCEDPAISRRVLIELGLEYAHAISVPANGYGGRSGGQRWDVVPRIERAMCVARRGKPTDHCGLLLYFDCQTGIFGGTIDPCDIGETNSPNMQPGLVFEDCPFLEAQEPTADDP